MGHSVRCTSVRHRCVVVVVIQLPDRMMPRAYWTRVQVGEVGRFFPTSLGERCKKRASAHVRGWVTGNAASPEVSSRRLPAKTHPCRFE
ncbi:hypothetical protein CDAR_98671 [Caerostris darwini]|uniref:Uncharacterized protein n=1 Tax=Caerostris darwini TaxID=1538125 RepID=A0AAV4Q4R8_9ARAC|nr:hypothetical protein CDAR_98671 [Caerostris darwini]